MSAAIESIGAEFVEAARGLVGTPFELGGRDTASGIDCAGLIVLAAARVGYDCPRLMSRAAVVRRWWPSKPPPEAREELEADLLACLDADLTRVSGKEARTGDVLLIKFPAAASLYGLNPEWQHLAIATARADRRWGVIHANPYPPRAVCERPLKHPWTDIQFVLGSWDRCVARVYRFRASDYE